MSFTPHELRQLAVTFPREHAAQIHAKSAKYGIPREDIRQELSLICLEKGAEFVSSKGSLPQFLFGHLDKRLRRQLGAHTFALSLDCDDLLDECTRALIDNLSVPANDDWTSPGSVDKSRPQAEARSKASGLTPPRWLWRLVRL